MKLEMCESIQLSLVEVLRHLHWIASHKQNMDISIYLMHFLFMFFKMFVFLMHFWKTVYLYIFPNWPKSVCAHFCMLLLWLLLCGLHSSPEIYGHKFTLDPFLIPEDEKWVISHIHLFLKSMLNDIDFVIYILLHVRLFLPHVCIRSYLSQQTGVPKRSS